MRKPTPITPPAQPQVAAYDWSRFGRHRLRSAAGNLLDTPLHRGPGGWLGTLWPDHRVPGGWDRMLWTMPPPPGHGWALPARLAGGDVLEFGTTSGGTGGLDRWYGIVDSYDGTEWLTIQGPYPHPAAAHADAEALLAQLRYQPPLRAQVTRNCTRTRRPRHP